MDTAAASKQLARITQMSASMLEAFISSAAASLLSHPDVAELLGGFDSIESREARGSTASLVAEVYGLVLAHPSSCDSSDGISSEMGANGARENTRSMNCNGSTGSSPEYLHVQERLDVLQSIGAEEVAEELMAILEDSCSASLYGEAGGDCHLDEGLVKYTSAIKSLVERVWEVASYACCPLDGYLPMQKEKQEARIEQTQRVAQNLVLGKPARGEATRLR